MKAPSGDLLFYAAMLLGGAIYIAIGLPTTAAEYQAVAVVFVACLAAEAVLLLLRFRWSPEVFVGLFVFVLGWGVVQSVTDGFTGTRIGMTVGAVVGLFAYPTLRREVREPATPSAEPDAVPDPAEPNNAHPPSQC